MLLDAERRDENWFRDRIFDFCIIGSGPAGITLALSLARRGHSVGLFEGGGMDRSSASQDLYVGASIGQDYFGLNHCRLRFFGGSSNHWGGWCRALDDYDFIKKRHYPFSGWPISKSELDPYREEAGRVLDLLTPLEEKDPNKLNSVALKRIHFEASPPTRFGTKFGGELRTSNNLC